MAITPSDWREIEAFVGRMLTKQGEPFIQGKVVRVDTLRKVVFLKEFGDTPIPVISYDHEFKWTDTSHDDLDTVHALGAAGEPAFQNGWVNYGGGYSGAAFWKDPFGTVHLRGLVKDGTANTIFQFPTVYRPSVGEIFAVDSGGTTSQPTHARIDIGPDGNVHRIAGGNIYVSLSGISFKAAARGPITKIKKNFTVVKMPKKGDVVLVAQHFGTRRLPKCLGVIKSKRFVEPSGE